MVFSSMRGRLVEETYPYLLARVVGGELAKGGYALYIYLLLIASSCIVLCFAVLERANPAFNNPMLRFYPLVMKHSVRNAVSYMWLRAKGFSSWTYM
jgi:hypothetical protein